MSIVQSLVSFIHYPLDNGCLRALSRLYTRQFVGRLFDTFQGNSGKISPQCNDFSRFSKICKRFTDFGRIFAWILLEIFKDFVSAEKLACLKPA